jgi:predicted MFS family arabinose efflux permease
LSTSIWRDGRFVRLFLGNSVSELGSSVTELALPTLAVLQLHAGPAELGLLLALRRVPFPILSVFVGVWIDRVQRRRVMIAADLLRALVLAVIPASAVFGFLSLWVLYAVALVMGTLTVFFDLAVLAYVPSLVGRDGLRTANSALQVNTSIADLAGPGLGGLLVQAVGAARAISVDAASFVVSVLSLWSIRDHRETPPPRTGASMVSELRDGITFVFGHKILRVLILVMAGMIAFAHFATPNLYAYAYQGLRISPGTLGGILSAGGGAAVIGALISRRVIDRLGTGWTLTATGVVTGLVWLPLLITPPQLAVPALVVIFVIEGLANPINNLAQLSLRQVLTPDRLQGRMNSVFRMVYWGIWPLGELVGGYAGSVIGPLPVIVWSGVWMALFSFLALVRPLRQARV